ncbi:17080_t:CDS:1, partial [Gigaspora margarita]
MSIAGEKVLPTVNEVKGWTKTEQLITFLDNQKQNFGLEDEHLDFFRKKGVNGISFLRLNADKLTNAGLELGPAETIAELIENIKGEGQ